MQQPFVVIVAATLAVLIACLSLMRGDARIIAAIPARMAPLGHFALYGLLAFACTRSLQSLSIAVHLQVLGGASLATGFGAAMEYAQKFRRGRFARMSDVFIDASGAAIGALLALA